jgi:cyclopropane-fatty-acyl-phospholipid synthase
VLDVGCGWGSFLDYVGNTVGCGGVGFTASDEQWRYAQACIAGNARLSVKHGDYREMLPVPRVSAAVSIGMYEHVGARKSGDFFKLVRSSLQPGMRYLNQAIVRPEDGNAHFRSNSFVQRYIFPNAQLLSLSQQLADAERARFRIIGVETFGRHYATTLSHWRTNLAAQRQKCVTVEGGERVRAWELYLAGSQRRFEVGSIDLAQVLMEAI